MKRSFAIILSVLALSVATFVSTSTAQEKKGRGQMDPQQRIDQIEQAVGSLTSDQKSQIKTILEKARQDAKGVSKEDRKTKGREILQETNKDIRAVLTPEQQTKFDAMGSAAGKRGKKKE